MNDASTASAVRRDSNPAMWDALTLGAAIRAREISCVEAMRAFLAQIDRFNPAMNAIVSLRDPDDLLREAAEKDEQAARGEIMGPLHGLPQAIKDLAATKGLRTTQGSPLMDTVPQADAIFVARTRRAGAIVIGKTNVPELGLGSQTYNPIFGLTRNPYDPAMTSGGSSGGAGVALALRMLPVADGSDHAGSLRNPAAFNNVFGLRTSSGRVPSSADEVFIPTMSVIGPMARSVADLQMLLSVQAGYDPRVPLSIADGERFAPQDLAGDIAGKRIGWLGDFGGHLPMEDGILDLCRTALGVYRKLGCVVEDVTPGFDPERIWQAWLKLRAWQSGAKLARYLDDPAKRALLKPEAQFEAESGRKLSAYDVMEASNVRSAWYQTVCSLFEAYDCLALPSGQVFPFSTETHWPPEIAGRRMDTYHRWMEVMIPVTMTGCPALGMPVGFGARGLPMGMQLVGPHRGERGLLQLAHAYEQETRWVDRRPPPMLTG
jgi:amidase